MVSFDRIKIKDFIRNIIMFQGQPFMEGLLKNKFLLYSLLSSTAAIFALALGVIPDIALQFEIVDFPVDVS
jgi:hypothetical protein